MAPPLPVTAASATERLFALSSDLLVVARDDRFALVNPAWQQALGHTTDDLIGRPWIELIHPDDRERTAHAVERARTDGGTLTDLENRVCDRHGRWHWLLWSLRWDDGSIYASAKDITERKALERAALQDPLTGLVNRTALVDRLGHALGRTARTGGRVAVLFCDLDGFKGVNDALGHDGGDEVLRAIAGRLQDAVGEADTVARFGGDEFVVVVEDAGTDGEIDRLVAAVLAVLRAPVRVGGTDAKIGASVGVAIADGPRLAQDVLREADVAMYRAKASGRGGWARFDARLRREVEHRLRVARELRTAADRGELRLVYQPIVSVQDEAVVGVEALLRWQHPDHGLLAPDAFLPIAEEDGEIVPIGSWVMREACRQARLWRRAGQDLAVSVNVSARQLAVPTFADEVAAIAREEGVPAPSICLEVTETALLSDADRVGTVLEEVKQRGFRIALDDFGRGYSSLRHVKALPVDVIKIDRAFVAGMADLGEDRAIVAAVLSLAEGTGLSVIAEGVEGPRELGVLRELRCPLVQGYYFGRPAPADELVLDGFLARGLPGVGDPFVIREFMRQIGIPARLR